MSINRSRFIISYSCGKDSTLALYRMLKEGCTPAALLITVNKETKKSFSHEVPAELLDKVSESLEIPLMIVDCEGKDYLMAFEKALIRAKEAGAEVCVFGDIDLMEHRVWCTARCDAAGIKAEFPLWEEDRESIAAEFVDAGFKAIIKSVQPDKLSGCFLGKTLSREVIEEIKAAGADACGENGEYHTFVYDGPIFKKPVEFSAGERLTSGSYECLNISIKNS
ncbi:MAG: diphthine--ammonia ligase [Bacillota bacterium]